MRGGGRLASTGGFRWRSSHNRTPAPYALGVLGRGLSIGTVIWIIIGLIVASNEGFLGRLSNLEGVLSAILAVLAWPLVLLDVHVAI